MVATLTSAVGTLGADLLAVGAIGVGISVGIFGLIKGYGVLRKLVK